MSNLIIKTHKILLLIFDLALFYLSLALTLILRYGQESFYAQWAKHFWPFTLIFIIWIMVLYVDGLYELKFKFRFAKIVGSLIKLFIANLFLAVIIFYFLSPLIGDIKPQRVLIIEILLALAFILVWRGIFPILFRQKPIKALIIGKSNLATELINEIKAKPHLGYELIFEKIMPENIKDYCLDRKIFLIIVNADLQKSNYVSQKLYECISHQIDIVNINRFYEKITLKVPVEDIEYGWFLDNLSSRPRIAFDVPKRAMDIILAGIGAIISLIVYPFVYLALKIDDGGGLYSVQERVGKNNKPIKLLKFRTMSIANDGAKWGETKNVVTRVGKFLRKSRIDELPQLWNVLRGDLSLIGPRPEFAEPVALYAKDISYYNIRHVIKPGLSGWAQIKQEGEPHHGIDINETRTKFSYDLYYIKNRNFLLDISIALKTIRTLILRKGI